MPGVFRIFKAADVGAIVDSEEEMKAFARQHGPGRYRVDQHTLDPFPGSNAKARAWGSVIHLRDGEVILDPIPWP